jgi:CHASE1-domain containing sensor protein
LLLFMLVLVRSVPNVLLFVPVFADGDRATVAPGSVFGFPALVIQRNAGFFVFA